MTKPRNPPKRTETASLLIKLKKFLLNDNITIVKFWVGSKKEMNFYTYFVARIYYEVENGS